MSDDVRFQAIAHGPALLAVVPLASAAYLLMRIVRSKPAPARCLWCAPALALDLAVGAWYALGLGSANLLALALFCAASVASAHLVLEPSRVRLDTRRLLVAGAVLGTLTLELTWNERWFTIRPQFWLVELVLVGCLTTALWLLGGRRGIGPTLGLFAQAAVGLVQHYVLEFRGTSILPSDIFALGTALSVSGGYVYDLSAGMLLGFGVLQLGVALFSLAGQLTQPSGPQAYPRDVLLAGAAVLVAAALVVLPSYGAVFGAQIDYWWSKDWYERQAFLPSFIYAWQDLAVTEPEGYSQEVAQQAQEELGARLGQDTARTNRYGEAAATFAAQPPNLIVIQNETFCDLSNFDELNDSYEGPRFWQQGMPDALLRGQLAVSVFGGGTCNTEFEFLTGNSLAFVGAAKYPFTMYDLSDTDSLPRQLAGLGYRTVGMHPNLASNWNRDRAYEQLGFDEFLDIDDFAGAEEFHTHVSDEATYDRTLDLLRQTDQPLFVFDVTMQNHSGYDTGSIPDALMPNHHVDGLSEDDSFQLNEYLACIEESDRALEGLVASLRDLDEPTVVVMYGDHHPWFSQALNDVVYPDEDALAHAERIHQTTYVVWANYELPSPSANEADDTSADLLAAMALDAAGAPLSTFQLAQLGARTDVRSINASGFLGADDVWRPLDDPGPYADTLHKLELVEYLNFGSRI